MTLLREDVLLFTREKNESCSSIQYFGDSLRFQLNFHVIYSNRETAIHPVVFPTVFPRPGNVAIRW